MTFSELVAACLHIVPKQPHNKWNLPAPAMIGAPSRPRITFLVTVRGEHDGNCCRLHNLRGFTRFVARPVGNADFPINLPATFNSGKPGIRTFMLHIADGKDLKLGFWIMDAPPGSGSTKIGEFGWSGNYFGTVQELLGELRWRTAKFSDSPASPAPAR